MDVFFEISCRKLTEEICPESNLKTSRKPPRSSSRKNRKLQSVKTRTENGPLWKNYFQTSAAGPLWKATLLRETEAGTYGENDCSTSPAGPLWGAILKKKGPFLLV